MKILIERTKTGLSTLLGVNQNSADYLRSILMAINHHGWVQDIKVIEISEITETITVTMLPQGATNPPDLVPELREVISQCADLKLISIEGVKNRIKVPGLLFLSKTPEDVVTYQVHLAYAVFLAKDISNAARCIKPEVFDVQFLLDEADEPDTVHLRGVACISSRKSMSGGPINAYNRFAQIVMKDANLRQGIMDDIYSEIEFIVKPNGSSSLVMAKSGCDVTDVIPPPTFN